MRADDTFLYVKEQPEHGFIGEWCLRRIRDKKNCLVLFQGEPGMGKSYCCLRVAQQIDPNFPINNVAFTTEQFMNLIQSGELKKGSVIIFDEAGVGINSNEWYSKQVIMFNVVLQTFRNLQLIVLFNVPDISYIESKSRKLIQLLCTITQRITDRNICIAKIERIKIRYDIRTKNKDVYTKYLRIYVENKGLLTQSQFFIKKPSDDLIKEYEEKKEKFSKNTNERATQQISDFGANIGGNKDNLTDRQRQFIELYENHTIKEIGILMNITQSTCSQYKRSLMMKGIHLKRKSNMKPKPLINNNNDAILP